MLEGVSTGRLKGAVEGRLLAETRRHGKYLFVALDQGPWLVLYLGKPGRLGYQPLGDSDLATPRRAVYDTAAARIARINSRHRRVLAGSGLFLQHRLQLKRVSCRVTGFIIIEVAMDVSALGRPGRESPGPA